MKNSLFFFLLLFVSCSPLKNSLTDDKHSWELKLQEVVTNLDDLKHDMNCFQTEIQILDGRIKYYENALAVLKQQDLEKQQTKLQRLSTDLEQLIAKWSEFENHAADAKKERQELATHANSTTAALTQFKTRIQELEKDLFSQNKRFEDLAKLKSTIAALATYKIYKVKSGDTLEKIASQHHTKVEKIKKLNDLERDLIVVDQDLKIPLD